MKKILQEFKQFAMRGNVVDMAVGIIIGGAFGKIVSSIVADLIMPAVGLLVGGVNFTDSKEEESNTKNTEKLLLSINCLILKKLII